ncbi:GNAT family N-acetyltransferase [Lacibacter sp. H375]|uniref:GNAT family N-acetyltransferase n=1 Tax=Lacibacter sp. H375 TaxID=3133424 RepID=UPI0030BADB36
MNHFLENPVYNALLTGDRHLSFGNEQVKYFDEEVSPFAGFAEDNKYGFAELYDLLPQGRRILYAIPSRIKEPKGWQLQHEIKGLQFVYVGTQSIVGEFSNVVPLTEQHVDEMIDLVKLTKPGPFGKRTISFGSYHGIFVHGKLVAMTGQRLHVGNYTELSAVCTHPDHLGKGYASVLMKQQLQIILNNAQQPFLHVRDDNDRAIAVYERLGFKVSRTMNFYFMKRV